MENGFIVVQEKDCENVLGVKRRAFYNRAEKFGWEKVPLPGKKVGYKVPMDQIKKDDCAPVEVACHGHIEEFDEDFWEESAPGSAVAVHQEELPAMPQLPVQLESGLLRLTQMQQDMYSDLRTRNAQVDALKDRNQELELENQRLKMQLARMPRKKQRLFGIL